MRAVTVTISITSDDLEAKANRTAVIRSLIELDGVIEMTALRAVDLLGPSLELPEE